MPNLPAVEATKRAVHDTRTRVLLSKTKMTSIAEACGRNRMTVAKWLDGDDISLQPSSPHNNSQAATHSKHSPTRSTPTTPIPRSLPRTPSQRSPKAR